MPNFRKRSTAVWSFPILIFLSGCNDKVAKVECDSFETRNEVLKIVADDHTNPLANYAAKNSDAASEGNSNPGSTKEQSANPETAKPSYRLGEKIVTTSVSADKRTLTCSGAISATVGDVKASKEVNFTVQQPPDGKTSVSVTPFQF
jgi:hypothetical protein